MKIIARHQSGYWANVNSPLFVQNVVRMRKGDCTLVTRTECTNQATNETLRRDFGGEDWGVHHPRLERRPVDCALEWDKEFWSVLDRGLKVLTNITITTKGGVELLPSSAPWVLLESKIDEDIWLLLSAAHNNLDNTPRRAMAWAHEAATFRRWQASKTQKLHNRFPRKRVIRLHQADVNKNLRNESERLKVRNHMLRNTGLKWKWDMDRLPAVGTHGGKPGQIIDYSFTNVEGGTKKMAGNKFSDHDPIETWLRV